MRASELIIIIDEITRDDQYYNNEIERAYSEYCLAKLKAILAEIDKKHPDTPLNAEIAAPLIAFLADNYRVTKDTNLAPTLSFHMHHTIACLKVAQVLEKIVNINRYKLLHPDLEVLDYVASGTSLNDDNYEISSFIMSDDGKRIIEIQACLSFAENDAVLKHTCLVEGHTQPLSPTEGMRVIGYLTETAAYWAAIKHKVHVETKGESFGAMITTLINALRGGGVSKHGEEYKAGHDANLGIIHFVEWFTALEQDEQLVLFKTPFYNETFEEYYNRLTKPRDYTDNIYCVESIANHLDSLLKHNKNLFEIYPKKLKVSADAPKLKTAVEAMQAPKATLAKAMSAHTPKRFYDSPVQLARQMKQIPDLHQHCCPNCWINWFETLQRDAQFDSLEAIKQFLPTLIKLYTVNRDLKRLFNLIPDAQWLAFIDLFDSAQPRPAQSFKHYMKYFDIMDNVENKSKLLKAKFQLILDFDDLIALLRVISVDETPKYALIHYKFITTFEQLDAVLKILPGTEETFNLILKHLHLFTNVQQLAAATVRFTGKLNTYLFILLTKKCYRDSDQVAWFNGFQRGSVRPSTDDLLFYFNTTINNGKNLTELLAKLNEDEREFIAIHYQEAIQNGVELANVLLKLPRDKRKSFLLENKDCIKNGEELGNLLAITLFSSEKEKIEFAESQLGKIANDTELAGVLRHYSFIDGCYLMKLATSKTAALSKPSELINQSIFCTPKFLATTVQSSPSSQL